MGDLLGHMLLVGQILFPLAGIGAIVFIVFRVASLIAGHGPEQPDAADPASPEIAFRRRAANRTGSVIAFAGLGLPWVTGLAVKYRLAAAGEPTYPISGFLQPTAVVVLLIASAALWCSPLLLLAAWIRSRFFTRIIPSLGFAERLLVARTTAAGGLISEIFIFARVFEDWDAMYIFVPIGAFLLPGMGLGCGIGMFLVRRRSRSKLQ